MQSRRRFFLIFVSILAAVAAGFLPPALTTAAPPPGHPARIWVPWKPIKTPAYKLRTYPSPLGRGPILGEIFKGWVDWDNGEYQPGYWQGDSVPARKPWYFLASPALGHYSETRAAVTTASYVGQNILVSAERFYSSPPVPELKAMGLVRGAEVSVRFHDWVPLRVMQDGRGGVSPTVIPPYVGHPYAAGNPPLPEQGEILLREILGDTGLPATSASDLVCLNPVWRLNGSPIDPAAVAETGGANSAATYKFIRLKAASPPPLRYIPQQSLELEVPLDSINGMTQLKQDTETGTIPAADTDLSYQWVHPNRFLYVQFRFRGLPTARSPLFEESLGSIPINAVKSLPFSLVLNHSAAREEYTRFLLMEQNSGIIGDPQMGKPVAAFPLATWRTGGTSAAFGFGEWQEHKLDTWMILPKGSERRGLHLPLPRRALPAVGWGPVDGLAWHTVTLKFNFTPENLLVETPSPTTVWVDGHTTEIPPLADIIAGEQADGSLKLRHVGGAETDPVSLKLRWNGGSFAPLDLCGFYVGLDNPLFIDADDDEVPPRNYVREGQSKTIAGYVEAFEASDMVSSPPQGVPTPPLRNLDLLADGHNDFRGNPIPPHSAGVPTKLAIARNLANNLPVPGIAGEFRLGDPMEIDTDLDDLPDAWELLYFASVADCLPADDFDEDYMSNWLEYELRYGVMINGALRLPLPTVSDTVAADESKIDWDTRDPLTNEQMGQFGFEYWTPDGGPKANSNLDGDAWTDLEELARGTDPLVFQWPEDRNFNPFTGFPLVSQGNLGVPPSLDGANLDAWLPPEDRGQKPVPGQPKDSDHDDVPDEVDGVPYDGNLSFAKVAESRYMLIPLTVDGTLNGLPEDGLPVAINDAGHILLAPPYREEDPDHIAREKISPRLWLGPGDLVTIPLPDASLLPFGYTAIWKFNNQQLNYFTLAKDSDQVLANPYWLPPPGYRPGSPEYQPLPSTIATVQRLPDLSGWHACVWNPVAPIPWQVLPFALPQDFQAPRLLWSGDQDYCDSFLSSGLQLLKGGRIRGGLLFSHAVLEEGAGMKQQTQDYLHSFSWLAEADGNFLLQTKHPFGGRGESFVEDPNPWRREPSRDSFSLDDYVGSVFTAHSWGRHTLATKYGGSYHPDSIEEFDYDNMGKPIHPPKNPLIKILPIHPPDDYFIFDPWSTITEEKQWKKLPVVLLENGEYMRAGAVNDMPDSYGSGPPNGRPYTTGPWLVGAGCYFVPLKGSKGNVWQSGKLIAGPAIDENGPLLFHPHAAPNNRGEIIGHIKKHQTETNPDPSASFGEKPTDALWRNGRGHYLEDLLTIPRENLAYTGLQAHAINDSGTIAASAVHPDTGRRIPMVLIPIESSFVTRNSETGKMEELGPLLPASDYSPIVQLEELSSTLVAGNKVRIKFKATTRDPYSETKAAGLVASSNLSVLVNKTLIAEFSGSPIENFPIAPQAPWTHRGSVFSFEKEFEIPVTSTKALKVELLTKVNEAGLVGSAGGIVILDRVSYGQLPAAQNLQVNLTLPPTVSDHLADSITVSGAVVATLSEVATEEASLIFSGPGSVDGAPVTCRVRISTFPSMTSPRWFNASLQYTPPNGETKEFQGIWQEESLGSNLFTTEELSSYNPPRSGFQISSTQILDAGGIISDPARPAIAPIAVRLGLPQALGGNNGAQFKGRLNDNPVDFKAGPVGFSEAPAPAGVEYLYATPQGADAPAIITLNHIQPEDNPSFLGQDNHVKMEVVIMAPDQEDDYDFKDDDPGYVAEEGLIDMAFHEVIPFGPSTAEPNPPYTAEDVILNYHFTHGEVAGQQLDYFLDRIGNNGGLAIRINDSTWWCDKRDSYIENVSAASQLLGTEPPTVWLNRKELPKVEDAVNELWDVVQQLRDMGDDNGICYQIKCNDWTRAVDFFIENSDNPRAAEQVKNAVLKGNRAALGETMFAFGRAALDTASFVSGTAGLATLTFDVGAGFGENSEAMSASVGTGLMVVFGSVASTSLYKICKAKSLSRLKVNFRSRLGEYHVLISPEVLNVMKVASTKSDFRRAALYGLEPLITAKRIPEEEILKLYRSGLLASASWLGRHKIPFNPGASKDLAYYLKQAGKTVDDTSLYRAHHYFPVELEEEFVMRGIDINLGPDSGEWMPLDFHKMIHGKGTRGQGWGRGGPWNYQWRQFFATAGPEGRSAKDIWKFKNDLFEKISNRQAQSAQDIDWLHKPKKLSQ